MFDKKKKDQEMTFPIVFDKCPNCGAAGVMKTISDEERQKGMIKTPNVTYALAVFQAAVSDPRAITLLTVPGVLVTIDACTKCGMLYATTMNKQQVQINQQQGRPGPQGGNHSGMDRLPR